MGCSSHGWIKREAQIHTQVEARLHLTHQSHCVRPDCSRNTHICHIAIPPFSRFSTLARFADSCLHHVVFLHLSLSLFSHHSSTRAFAHHLCTLCSLLSIRQYISFLLFVFILLLISPSLPPPPTSLPLSILLFLTI